jgi:hypothetical protein
MVNMAMMRDDFLVDFLANWGSDDGFKHDRLRLWRRGSGRAFLCASDDNLLSLKIASWWRWGWTRAGTSRLLSTNDKLFCLASNQVARRWKMFTAMSTLRASSYTYPIPLLGAVMSSSGPFVTADDDLLFIDLASPAVEFISTTIGAEICLGTAEFNLIALYFTPTVSMARGRWAVIVFNCNVNLLFFSLSSMAIPAADFEFFPFNGTRTTWWRTGSISFVSSNDDLLSFDFSRPWWRGLSNDKRAGGGIATEVITKKIGGAASTANVDIQLFVLSRASPATAVKVALSLLIDLRGGVTSGVTARRHGPLRMRWLEREMRK